MKKLLAYHNDPALKEKFLARVCAHAKADEIVKGKYWQDGKGCAVGCTIHSSDHSAYETELGIPWRLAVLEDVIFENLPNQEAVKWPIAFLAAIKPGSDLSLVVPRFMLWMLVDSKDGVIRFAKGDGKAAIHGVAELWESHIKGKKVSNAEHSRAESAARSAAESAAWSVARSAAGSAAWSATGSAARSAAESAAWSAAGSAARSAAESAAWSAAGSAAWSAAGSAVRSAAGSAAWSAAESATWSMAEFAAWSAAASAAWSVAFEVQAAKLLQLISEAR